MFLPLFTGGSRGGCLSVAVRFEHKHDVSRHQRTRLHPFCVGHCFGAQSALILNAQPNAFQIGIDLIRGDAQHVQPQTAQKGVAPSIVSPSLRRVVPWPINLDDEMCIARVEIGDVRPQRMLPSKFEAGARAAQHIPQLALAQRGFAAQLDAPFSMGLRAGAPVAITPERSWPQPGQDPMIARQPERVAARFNVQADHPAAVRAFNDATNRVRQAVVTDDEVSGAKLIDRDQLPTKAPPRSPRERGEGFGGGRDRGEGFGGGRERGEGFGGGRERGEDLFCGREREGNLSGGLRFPLPVPRGGQLVPLPVHGEGRGGGGSTDARPIAGYVPTPHFRAVPPHQRPTPHARWVEYKVAGVCRHQHATLDNLAVRLDNIIRVRFTTSVGPYVNKFSKREVPKISLVDAKALLTKEAANLPELLRPFNTSFPMAVWLAGKRDAFAVRFNGNIRIVATLR